MWAVVYFGWCHSLAGSQWISALHLLQLMRLEECLGFPRKLGWVEHHAMIDQVGKSYLEAGLAPCSADRIPHWLMVSISFPPCMRWWFGRSANTSSIWNRQFKAFCPKNPTIDPCLRLLPDIFSFSAAISALADAEPEGRSDVGHWQRAVALFDKMLRSNWDGTWVCKQGI